MRSKLAKKYKLGSYFSRSKVSLAGVQAVKREGVGAQGNPLWRLQGRKERTEGGGEMRQGTEITYKREGEYRRMKVAGKKRKYQIRARKCIESALICISFACLVTSEETENVILVLLPK